MIHIHLTPTALGHAAVELPPGPLITWTLVGFLGWLLVVVPTVVSILRARDKLGGLDTALWLILTALFPVIGLALWLVVGKRRAEQTL